MTPADARRYADLVRRDRWPTTFAIGFVAGLVTQLVWLVTYLHFWGGR